MKQHITGFILFNLIVGASVVVAALFYSVPNADSVRAPEAPTNYVKTTCWRSRKMRKNEDLNAKVVQAVFNENTNQLDMNLSLNSRDTASGFVSVEFDFFVKDGNQTRYLASETLHYLKPEFNLDGKATQSIISSYQWLDDLKSHENLYVVPRTGSNAENENNSAPRFDESNATSVIVINGN